MPKARSFQGIALTSPGVNQGDIEGGFQVNGASGAENCFTVDGVEHQQPALRQLAAGHGLRVPAGSAGQDRRHRRRVRRRARRRDQRGDQVGRQQVHRRRPLLLLGQRDLARARCSGCSSARSTTRRCFTCRTTSRTNNRNEVGGSIGGPIVKDQLFFFGSVSPRFVRRTNDYLVLERHRAGHRFRSRRPRRRRSARSPTRSRRVQANGSVLCDAAALDRHAVGLRRHRARTSSAARWPAMPRRSPRLRPGSDQRQRQRGLLAERRLARSACAAASSPTTTRTPASRRRPRASGTRRRSACAGVPANLQLPTGAQNTPRVLITNSGPDQDGLRPDRLQPRVQRGRLAPAQGWRRRSATRRTTSTRPIPAATCCSTGARRSSTTTGQTGTGTYGYYEVNDRGTRGTRRTRTCRRSTCRTPGRRQPR